MFDASALLAVLVGLFAAHLAVIWLARRRAVGATEKAADHLDDGRVRCGDCESINDPEYLFCRECVGKLPERAPIRHSNGGSLLR